MKNTRKKSQPQLSWILYPLLVVLIAIYAISNNALFGALVVLVIAAILVFEVKYSVKTEGTKDTIIGIATAVGAAIAVWIIIIFVLNTTAPLDVVSSCSMLPVLHRGDLVVLQGSETSPSSQRACTSQ